MITALCVGFKIRFQIIRKEKDPEDGKHDEELHHNDQPQGSTDGHTPEAVVIKIKNPGKNISFQSN